MTATPDAAREPVMPPNARQGGWHIISLGTGLRDRMTMFWNASLESWVEGSNRYTPHDMASMGWTYIGKVRR